jgi:hypothetical protein
MNEHVSTNNGGDISPSESSTGSSSPTPEQDMSSSAAPRSYASILDGNENQTSRQKDEFNASASVVGRDVDDERRRLELEIESLQEQHSEAVPALEYHPGGSDWATAKAATEAQLVATLREKQQQLQELQKADRRNFFTPAPEIQCGPEPDDPEEELEPSF